MKDYSETVQVEFDPREISYRELLEVFWASHDPTSNIFSRQYRNAIFYVSEKQRIEAEKSREQLQQKQQRPIFTAIEKAGTFYPAEGYHQKYYLRRMDRLIHEFKQIYPDDEQFIMSTAAARINGYLGCNGTAENLQQEIIRFGLSQEGQQYLLDYVKTACQKFGGVSCSIQIKE